jgi:hypothetical protein
MVWPIVKSVLGGMAIFGSYVFLWLLWSSIGLFRHKANGLGYYHAMYPVFLTAGIMFLLASLFLFRGRW